MKWIIGLVAMLMALSMVYAVDTTPPVLDACFIANPHPICGDYTEIQCNSITDDVAIASVTGKLDNVSVNVTYVGGDTYKIRFLSGEAGTTHTGQLFATDNSSNEGSSPLFEYDSCITCAPDWQPLDWTACDEQDLTQTRTYTDLNVCGTEAGKPEDESRTCAVSSFTYGDSTDFTQVEDPTNVSDAVVETLYGQIAWVHPIDVAGFNLDDNIIINEDSISVNVKDLDPSMNMTAVVTARMVDGGCDKFKLWYVPTSFSDNNGLLEQIIHAERVGETEFYWFDEMNQKTLKVKKMADKQRIGMDCTDASVCKDIHCSANTLQFEAQHFSGYVFSGGEYTSDDMQKVVIDGLVKFGIVIVGFMSIITMVLIFKWGKKTIRK